MRAKFLLVVALAGSLHAQQQAVKPKLEFEAGTGGTWNLSWDGSDGHTYFLQFSDDLKEWQYFPRIETGHDEGLGWGLFADGALFFVRIQCTNASYVDPEFDDYDGDDIRNWIEVKHLNTNPLSDHTAGNADPDNEIDSDDDGLPDYLEFEMYGTIASNPAMTDYDGDGACDGDEYDEETSLFEADTDGDGIPDGIDNDPLVADSSGGVAAASLHVWTPDD